MALSICILAAGQGTRMNSDLPKVLHPLAGRPLLEHVIDTAETLAPDSVHVVYGYGGDSVREALAHRKIQWHEQAQQLGTGHAVMQAMPGLNGDETLVILYGDVPLIDAGVVDALAAAAGSGDLVLVTAEPEDPTGYGRIVRDSAGRVVRIVEHKDASAAEAAIGEINTGLMACSAARMGPWLDALKNDNAQGEYYLTDVVALAVADGVAVHTVSAPDAELALGVNDKLQLATAERVYRQQRAMALLQAGVTLADPDRLDVRGTLTCGRDVFIDVNVVIEGDVELGDNVHIGPNNVIRDSSLGQGTVVQPNCVIERAHCGPDCLIGPFARVRPETYLGSEVKIGNFVEVKKSNIAMGSKVSHLSYIGDTTIGEAVNVGAGTITCNYDGANKYRTVIGDGAFIGSGTQLVAPVTIGDGATIGAGSVITKDAPARTLTIARGKQVSLKGWKRPVKNKPD